MTVTAHRGQYGLEVMRIHTRLPSIAFGSRAAANEYANVPNHIENKVIKPIVF